MAHNPPLSRSTQPSPTTMLASASDEFRAGALALLLVGVMPFGMIYGALVGGFAVLGVWPS